MSIASRAVGAVAKRVARWPFDKASRRGRALGRLLYRVDARHRGVAERNLKFAFPERHDTWHRDVARRSFEQAGRTLVEMLWSSRLLQPDAPAVVELEGGEHLTRALAAGRGALLATGHFGNWELAGTHLPRLGVPLTSIARPLDDKDLDLLLNRLRSANGAAVLPKAHAVRGALRALRAGRAVAILTDQNTLRREAVFVPFFGRLAATTPVIAHLHLRSGAPILPTFTIPFQDHYKLVLEAPLVVAHADRHGAVDAITAAVTARFEHHARESPHAWLWMHDRWRERPEGESVQPTTTTTADG